MKRWFTRIILVIVLGVIANVAIAWGIAYRVDYARNSYQGWQSIKPPNSITVNIDVDYGVTNITSIFHRWGNNPLHERQDVLPSWSLRHRDESYWYRGQVANSFEIATGWPFRSFKSACLYLGTLPRVGEVIYGIELEPIPHVRMIPTRPIWMGFIGNTLAWALLFGTLWCVVKTSLHVVRRFKGQCHNCSYDLRGTKNNRCPECGSTINSLAAVPDAES